jgi:voltage-gated potassium channel
MFRVARLVRILRILHRTSPREMWQTYKEHRGESAFWTTALVTFLLLALASLRILHIEEGSPEANIHTATDALW